MKHLIIALTFVGLLCFLIVTAVNKLKKMSDEFGWSWMYGSFYILPCVFFTFFTMFVCWAEYHKWLGY